MLEGIQVTLIGSGKHPDVTFLERGSALIALNRGGGVALLGNWGRVQGLADEVTAGSLPRSEIQEALINRLRPLKTESRRYKRSKTAIVTQMLLPGCRLRLRPLDPIDRFKYNGRFFPTMDLEAVPLNTTTSFDSSVVYTNA